MHSPPIRSEADYADVHAANSAVSIPRTARVWSIRSGPRRECKEPDALEGEAGKRPISVVKKSEKLVQLDHCVRKCDLLGALGSEFLKEILVPILGDRVVVHALLVGNPQREVGVVLRKMAEQFPNLFPRRGRSQRVIF